MPAVSAQNKTWCYADESDHYFQFATVTAYEDVFEKNTQPVVVRNCQPIQFWLLCRHGTRYPNENVHIQMQSLTDFRDQIIKNHEIYQGGELCTKDLNNLKNWNLQAVARLSGELTPQGHDDLHKLAIRYKARFPTLLNRPYDSEKFEFRTTDTQRTAASAIAFADGLFGPNNSVKFPEPQDPDMLLKPYRNCKKYEENLPKLSRYINNFHNTTDIKTLQNKVSQRLGFNETLTIDDINTMYDICRFDHAWHPNVISPWCAVFTEEELQVLEYREDLLNYYYNGYGNKINLELGCLPIKDLFDRISGLEKCKKQAAGVFYFTHSEMLQMALLPLGIAMDKQPLTSCNFKQMNDRYWRTSKLMPFAANLVAVIYKCEDGEKYQIQFYLNERPITLDGCQQSLCNWSTIKETFGHISSNCTLDGC